MKILRLSLFNIRKHKVEAVSLFIMLLLSIVLLVSAVSGIGGMNSILKDAYDRTGSFHNFISMPLEDYKDIYAEYLEKDERVTSFDATTILFETNGKYLDKRGEEATLYTAFATEESNAVLQELIPDSSMTMEEIRTKEHFVLMPYFMKDSIGFHEGDEFVFLYNEKAYPFEVAGFYEASYMSDTSYGVKLIISDGDYNTLHKILQENVIIGYELADGMGTEEIDSFVMDFTNFAEDNAVMDEAESIGNNPFYLIEMGINTTTKLLMGIMIVMAVVVFAAVIFMIGYRIKSDIEEQMVSIGVLEALGHSTGEVMGIYILEYLIIAAAAVIVGMLASIFTVPLMGRIGEIMTGHHGGSTTVPPYGILFGLLLILFVLLFSFLSSRRVKKYPPVTAFRKGTGNHTHKRNVLPLEKTKTNVHIRLAIKGFFANMKTNIGVGLCIVTATIALTLCFLVNGFMGKGMNAIIPVVGLDLPDIRIEAMTGVDIDGLRQEILSMPEVRKVNVTNDLFTSFVAFDGVDIASGPVIAYDDFEETENIHPNNGRYPKHDNECMLAEPICDRLGLHIGDTVCLKNGKLEADYIVCGTVTSTVNGGANIYMTNAAHARVRPGCYLDQIEIYLNEGVNKKEFKSKLYALYGTPGSEVENRDMSGASLEDRIRAEADRKIGILLEMYKVDSVDYAIMIGDEMIAGNSRGFKIRAGLDLTELMISQLSNMVTAFGVGTAVFMAISVFVIMIILFILVITAVRNQRGELGIMKGMGYTSKELMLQMAARIMPTLILSVIIGSIAGYFLTGMVMRMMFGVIGLNFGKVLLMDILVCLFGFATGYFSARKIKNISVYELMQE